jgi:hypothetical protein
MQKLCNRYLWVDTAGIFEFEEGRGRKGAQQSAMVRIQTSYLSSAAIPSASGRILVCQVYGAVLPVLAFNRIQIIHDSREQALAASLQVQQKDRYSCSRS